MDGRPDSLSGQDWCLIAFADNRNQYSDIKQESCECAIAEMTAQRALYMGALKISGLPDYAHGYYSQHFSWAFVTIDPMTVPTKFEVRSFTRS